MLFEIKNVSLHSEISNNQIVMKRNLHINSRGMHSRENVNLQNW